MTIENGYISTIEAQRAALDQRQDIINALLADNIAYEATIRNLTGEQQELRREIIRLRRATETIGNILVATIQKL